MAEDINSRQQAILRVIVSEFVTSARPVGSDTIVDKYDLKVSPATVRNDMSALEAGGFVFHPHTSSGRVPSDRGYRFFVERLMGMPQLPAAEQRTISHQFHQVELALDEWVQLATSVLAQTTSSAALATMPLSRESRLRHIELFLVQPRLALMVLVLQEGILRKQIIDLAEDSIGEDELERIAHRLDACFRGHTTSEIDTIALPEPVSPSDVKIRDALVKVMRALDEQGLKNIWYDGVTQLLNLPEFAQVERLREFLGLMDNNQSITNIVLNAVGNEGVSLVIGEEHTSPALKSYSVALARYGRPGEVGGVIGIIGPTRMRYDRAISAVRYMADLLSNLWRGLQ